MFIFELFFEFFFEFLFEGIYELSLSKKTPLWLRVTILLTYGFVGAFILIGLAAVALILIVDNERFLGIFILVVDLIFVYGITKKIYKDFVAYPRF